MGRGDEPPEEAYGRVTNPTRYAVLHSLVDGLVEDLVTRFDVSVARGVGLDRELVQHVEPIDLVRLTPSDPSAAPLTLVRTAFPGLLLHAGRHVTEALPACGCDACDEDPADLSLHLDDLVADVTAGRLREEVRVGPDGRWLVVERWGPDRRNSDETLLDTGDPRVPWSIRWVAWPTAEPRGGA